MRSTSKLVCQLKHHLYTCSSNANQLQLSIQLSPRKARSKVQFSPSTRQGHFAPAAQRISLKHISMGAIIMGGNILLCPSHIFALSFLRSPFLSVWLPFTHQNVHVPHFLLFFFLHSCITCDHDHHKTAKKNTSQGKWAPLICLLCWITLDSMGSELLSLVTFALSRLVPVAYNFMSGMLVKRQEECIINTCYDSQKSNRDLIVCSISAFCHIL